MLNWFVHSSRSNQRCTVHMGTCFLELIMPLDLGAEEILMHKKNVAKCWGWEDSKQQIKMKHKWVLLPFPMGVLNPKQMLFICSIGNWMCFRCGDRDTWLLPGWELCRFIFERVLFRTSTHSQSWANYPFIPCNIITFLVLCLALPLDTVKWLVSWK